MMKEGNGADSGDRYSRLVIGLKINHSNILSIFRGMVRRGGNEDENEC